MFTCSSPKKFNPNQGKGTYMAIPSTGTRLQQFSPPGNLDDFNADQKTQWSSMISDIFDQVIIGFPNEYDNDGPRNQFYNPLNTDPAPDLTSKVISWVGFPRKVKMQSPTDEKRWSKADGSRDVQDEYCEWSVKKDSSGKIASVTFTCEGPEYWEFLGQTDPNRVVELYQKYIDPKAKKDHLFNAEGKYQTRNKWNDTGSGAMHLIQRNNTLYAEIELAAGSSVVRQINGKILTEQQALIKCGQYGNPERNSDPFIGSEVNTLARAGAMISLADPVGLYLDEFKTPGWETPDGSDPASYWKILRGASNSPVRAIYEVPADRGFVVGDIKINGKNIHYGAQIADFVHIKLTGIAQQIGQIEVKPLTACRTPKATPAHHGMMPSAFIPTPPQFITRASE